jgi:GNAT superfamily N-acetyltransferase
MLTLRPTTAKEIPLITELSKETFDDDSMKFSPDHEPGGPEGYDSAEFHRKALKSKVFLSICWDDEVIGALFYEKQKDNHFHLNRIFIHPKHQHQGYGKKVFELMEGREPEAVSWSLDTPEWAVKNHYFYSNLGYVKEKEYAIEGFDSKLWFFRKPMK